MRNSELSEGIDVMDQNRNTVGTSKIAAKKVRKLTFDNSKGIVKYSYLPCVIIDM